MATVQQQPAVLTAKEAAEYLRISESTLRRYASRRVIPGRQLGKEWRFSRLALEEWLRSASGKEVLLSQAGAFADDAEDLAELRAAIYRERRRDEAGEAE